MPGPLLLLADSRRLYSEAFAARVRGRSSAVYLGAPNGDEPAFFQMCQAAFDPLGIPVVHVSSPPTEAQREALERADVVFLSGGDPVRGLERLRAHGLDAAIARRHAAGALLVGSSAGAMIFGARILDGETSLPALGFVPRLVEAHGEPAWPTLAALARLHPRLPVLGLLSGGGAWVEAERLLAFGAGYVEAPSAGEAG